MSKRRRPEFGEERRSRGERSRSDTSHGTGGAEPPHPVHLTSLGAKHIPHLASEHTPRGGPATARPAPRGEADGDRHSRMLPHGSHAQSSSARGCSVVILFACGRGSAARRGGEGGHVRYVGGGAFASSPPHRLDHCCLLHRVRPAEAWRGASGDRPGGGVQLDAVGVVFARAKPERAVRVSRRIFGLAAAAQLDAPGAALMTRMRRKTLVVCCLSRSHPREPRREHGISHRRAQCVERVLWVRRKAARKGSPPRDLAAQPILLLDVLIQDRAQVS
jgi:hypothetical protein